MSLRFVVVTFAALTAVGPLVLTAFTLDADAKGKRKPRVIFDSGWQQHPSARYGSLTGPKCLAELTRRGIAFTPVERAPGVLAPVRLTKDIGGVLYRTDAPDHTRAQSPHEVFDCRLVLALSDFSVILRSRAIDEVRIFSAWRPPPPSWPDGKLAIRHPGALAIDIARFGKALAEGQLPKDRQWLNVKRDWSGAIGAPACGPGAASPRPTSSAPLAPAKELRSIVCEASEQRLFTSILTPNYNRAHENHFHLEITPDVAWHLVR